MKQVLQKLGPALGLVVTWILFAALAGHTFTSWSNQQLMLLQTAVVGTAAVGATWIVVSGGIDLSVGSSIALGTMVVALLLNSHWPAPLAALGGIAVGVLVGALIGALVVGRLASVIALVAAVSIGGWLARANGWIVGVPSGAALAVLLGLALPKVLGRLPLSPFIVTLGLWGALRGLAKGLGDNQPIYPQETGVLGELMYVAPSGVFHFLPPGVWILALTAALAALAMRYTRFGRRVFAIGSNEETARLCGVDVERTKIAVYALAVGCAGIAAVLQLSYLSMGDPTTAQGYELKVIAAVVIGGASLSGGQGSIVGTLIGALIMTVVDNGCTKLGLDNWVQELVTGGIIVAAVALDRLRARTSE